MTDHKFTDDEIIKALECCSPIISEDFDCDICPYNEKGCNTKLVRDALALINRQKAEIESLQAVHADMTESLRLAAEANKDMSVELDAMRGAANSYKMHYENAIKEFAQRLKKKMYPYNGVDKKKYAINAYAVEQAIECIAKEMTEESK